MKYVSEVGDGDDDGGEHSWILSGSRKGGLTFLGDGEVIGALRSILFDLPRSVPGPKFVISWMSPRTPAVLLTYPSKS